MKSKLELFTVLTVLVVLFWLTSRIVSGDRSANTITVFAAASTIDAMNEVVVRFQKDFGDVQIRTNFASSSSLAMMLEQNVEADFFLSADTDLVEQLDHSAGSSEDFLSNQLVAIKRKDATKPIEPSDFQGRIAMGDPQHVPAGKYAKRYLEKMNRWDKVKPVSASDVRQVLALVANGAADIGLVYATDAKAAEDQVTVVYQFDDPEIQITYSLYQVLRNQESDAGRLAQFMRGKEAAAIFTKHGFTPLFKSN